MHEATSIPEDSLLATVSVEEQRQAAATVQDVFARLFRHSMDESARDSGLVEELDTGLANWCKAGATADTRAARLAMILSGLDQWGLAYAQSFELAALPALTELMGNLRTRLDPEEEARFQRKFELIQSEENAAIDFKIDLRRSIHLALWHAMIAGDDEEDALRILSYLGGAMVHLTRTMPSLGWRLVADTLTHIQLRCLNDGLAAEGLGQEMTQATFESLRRTLAADEFNRIMALSTRALMEWQQARRANLN